MILNSASKPAVQSRVIVVALVQNEQGDFLICRMPRDRGVFPGQWGLPGGGIEAGERMEAALRREIKEELGIEISDIKPLFFKDGLHEKSFADASKLEVYMIFLVFLCRAASDEIKLSPEFSDYAWVSRDTLQDYDLNSATVETFLQAGVLSSGPDRNLSMPAEQLTTRFANLSDCDFVGQDLYLSTEILQRKIEWREIVVAEQNGSLVGYLRLEYLWSRKPFIALIRVLPEFRRQGIGKALLAFAEESLRAEGYTVIYSSSQVNDPEAQAWHRHIGFEECGAIAGINEGGIGEVFFRKRLK